MDMKHAVCSSQPAVIRQSVVLTRAEIRGILSGLIAGIPEKSITGPPFCIFNFITSVQKGYDITLGVPVRSDSDCGVEMPVMMPEMEILSRVHRGEPEKLRETAAAVFGYADRLGVISDEFYREVYLDETHPDGPGIEVQFVVHNWSRKLTQAIDTVLGASVREWLMQGSGEGMGIEAGVSRRFEWVKAMLARLDEVADKDMKYDILSRCAHVFPSNQVAKLAAVFRDARSQTGDSLQAVDAVIAFMNEDPGWTEGGIRRERTIYFSKNPRDPKAHNAATTELERRQAACFCPIVRSCMDQEMPVDFCYCGSGWLRQQWEGAIGWPVTIDIVRSVLRGDDRCEFAVHLPEDLS
ncbi:hypothetical protein JXA80_13840 [bacterium]|nr:hypothetical protein [candidate division CSSED10-310 bacterium]